MTRNVDSFIRVDRDGELPVVHLIGDWNIANARALEAELETLPPHDRQTIIVNGQELKKLDTAGALLLKDYAESRNIKAAQIRLDEFGEDHETFLTAIWQQKITQLDAPERATFTRRLITQLGKSTYNTYSEILNMTAFGGRIFVSVAGLARRPANFRGSSLVRHMDEAGIRAIPIVSLLAFLISIVLAYQGAVQLRNFGADIFTIDLTVVSILREMGVLLTAIMVAGRSGSAYAAEIGVMKLREEVNALQTLGLDPYHLLIVPRIIALVVMMPVLTFFADCVGLFGTSVMTYLLLDIDFTQFIARAGTAIKLNTFMIGIVKAPVFGFLISLVGTYQGMQVSGSAESVGRLTTLSVVQSIFLVILADAMFSILFSSLGI